MTAITFDTQAFAEELRAGDFSESQATTLTRALRKVHSESEITTRADLREMEMRLDGKLRDLQYNLTLRMGAMTVTGVAILGVLIKIL